MKLLRLVAPVTILGIATLMSLPRSGGAFALLGNDNDADHNGFQVFQSSFTDALSNNNITPDVNFPGSTGAAMAVWKAAAEWNSELRANNGNGDPLQPGGLGSGNSNYDWHYQGVANSGGGNFAAVVSGTGFLGASVFAVTSVPGGGNGWKMSFDDSQWNWVDGPGNETGGNKPDIQGIGCHEFGHALGLAHSNDPNATMFAFTSEGGSPGERSIATDDTNGIIAIYTAKSATKPKITGISGGLFTGGTLTVTGTNFSGTSNEVWFTKNTGGSVNANPMTPVKVACFSNSATSVSVIVPGGIADGEIIVHKQGASTSHSLKSAPFPFDLNPPPPYPIVNSVTPASIATMAAATPQLTIDGLNFSAATGVSIGGRTYTAGQFTIINDTQVKVTFNPPPVDIGNVNVIVTNAFGNSPATTQVTLTLPTTNVILLNPFNPPSGGSTTIYMGAPTPGEVPLIAFSQCFSPVSIPPYVTLSIGGCGDLDFVPVIPPAFASNGVTSFLGPIPAGFHGIIFLQFCRLNLVTPTFPMTVSNIGLISVP